MSFSGTLRTTWGQRSPFLLLATVISVLALEYLYLYDQNLGKNRALSGTLHPASEAADEMRFALSRQASALRGYMVSGDPRYLERYHQWVHTERAAAEILREHAPRIGSDIQAQFLTYERHSEQWKQIVRVVHRTTSPEEIRDAVFVEPEVYDQLLGIVMQMDRTLSLREREMIQALQEVERQGAWVGGGLGLLALLGLAMLWKIAETLRFWAREAELGKQTAEEVLVEKEAFVRGLTHDLKGPVAIVRGYSELLLLDAVGEMQPAQREVLEAIEQTAAQMEESIEGMLYHMLVQRTEGGDGKFCLGALTESVVQQRRILAAQAGLEVHLERVGSLNAIPLDPLRVRHALENLLGNAIRYTPPGGQVRIRVSSMAHPEHPQKGAGVAVEFQDTGPGIPLDLQEQIFEETVRGPTSQKGHGIGLAFTRRLLRSMGGDVFLASTPGEGACFTLWLPQAA